MPSHAAVYAKYRSKPPTEVLGHILSYLNAKTNPPFKLAVDIGCGSGQSTQQLAPHFEKVIGVDVSEAQIREAQINNSNNNVIYKVGSCTNIPERSNTVQLLTASQSHHWFDLTGFYKETQRVLDPKGAVCVFWYQLPQPMYKDKTNALQKLLNHIYHIETKEYWHQRRQLVDNGFDGLDFPFEDVVKENIFSETHQTAAEYIGYIESWSAFQNMQKADPNKSKELMNTIKQQFQDIIDEDRPMDEIPLTVQFTYFLIMGRKKAK